MNEVVQPLVSVITPVYNAEPYIEEYLESVLKQTYNHLELILINDGSTDNSDSIIRKYKTKVQQRGYIFIYITQKHSGQAAALNKGLAVFTGEYFTWPDADDILVENNIELKIKYMLEFPQYSLVRGRRKFIDNKLELVADQEFEINITNENIFYDLFLERTFASGGCYLIRRSVFLECYRNRRIYAGLGSQNWQLLVPASSRTKCGFIDETIYIVRINTCSFSRKNRTLKEWFERFDDHRNLLIDSFNHSLCNKRECLEMVDKKYARKKFEVAVLYKDKFNAAKQYIILRKMKIHTLTDTIRLILLKNNLLALAQNIAFFLRSIGEKKLLRGTGSLCAKCC